MNKNISRIIFGCVFGIAIFTILLCLLDKTPLLWTAYAWCIFAVAAFGLAMGFWAKSHADSYILRAPYPMVVWSYLFWTIGVAVFFVVLEYTGLWAIKFGWFCLIEFVILAINAWRLQAIDAAREEIESVDQYVKVQTYSWKMIRVDMMNLTASISGADKKIVSKAAETVRYADPMEHPAVEDIVANLYEKISDLKTAAAENNSLKISTLCREIEQLVNERANKLKILK